MLQTYREAQMERAQGRFEALNEEAEASMAQAMEQALLHDSSRELDTPGWYEPSTGRGASTAPALDVIQDELDSDDGAGLAEVLRMIGNAARGEDVTLHAAAWIKAQATKYARLHAAELANNLLDGEALQ